MIFTVVLGMVLGSFGENLGVIDHPSKDYRVSGCPVSKTTGYDWSLTLVTLRDPWFRPKKDPVDWVWNKKVDCETDTVD